MKFRSAALAAAISAACLPGAESRVWAQSTAVTNSAAITLEDAIQRTLSTHPYLDAAVENRRAAEGARRQAALRPNPSFEFEAENIAGTGAFDGFDQGEYTYGLAQQLELGGQRSSRKHAADADVVLAKLAQIQAKLDLVFDVQQAFTDVLAASALHKAAADQAALAREIERAVDRRVKNARDPQAAGLRVSAQASEFALKLGQAAANLDQARWHLSSLWGTPTTDFVIQPDTLFQTSSDYLTTAPSLDEALEVAVAAAAKKRAEAMFRLERARAVSNPTIGVGVRHFASDDEVAGVVTLSMPIALFNRNQGAIQKARAELSKGEQEARANKMILERRLQAAMSTLRSSHDAATAFRTEIIPKAETALRSVRDGYRKGAFTYLDVLDAQRALTGFRAAEIETLRQLRMAEAQLDRLTGRYAANSPVRSKNNDDQVFFISNTQSAHVEPFSRSMRCGARRPCAWRS